MSGPSLYLANSATQRIAYLVNQYPKVSHTFIRREIRALEKNGFDVYRFALRGEKGELADKDDFDERKRTRYLLGEGVLPLIFASTWAFLRSPNGFSSALLRALEMGGRADRPRVIHLVYLAEAALLVRWMHNARVQHLHSHFGTNSAAVAMLARIMGGPSYSFTVHGPEEFDKPEFLHLALKVEHAHFVVAISSFGKSQLCRWLPFKQWPKVKVVHCGIDAQFHEAQTSQPYMPTRLVCVGRLCEQKGQFLLVQAMAQLRAKGIFAELILAGDGEMRAELEALVERLSLTDHIRITGWISSEQVRDEILAAKALVLPSFAEGLPVVIMEAMALKRPVISTFVAGIPELVLHGETGWLVPAGDLTALVSAIEVCLAMSASEINRMGTSAHTRVLERHDIDREAAKLAAYFNESIGGGDRSNLQMPR